MALCCALFFASPAAAETLTNATVIQLVKAGLGNEAVIAKIKSTDGTYNLGTDDLIALKNEGVPGDVIAAMISGRAKSEAAAPAMSITDINPMTPHPSGLYLIDDIREPSRPDRPDGFEPGKNRGHLRLRHDDGHRFDERKGGHYR